MKYISTLALLLVTGMFAELASMENGALNMTGAPFEGDCTGCHGGSPNSDANGKFEIKVVGNPTKYVQGATYDIQVTSTYSGKTKFGFALGARMSSKGSMGIGKLTGGTDLMVTDFVTHTNASNTGVNTKTWNFTWQAPVDGTEPVILYAAGLIGNGDRTNAGDKVYTTNYTFGAPNGTSVEDAQIHSFFKLFPNPGKGQLVVEGYAQTGNNLTIEVYDVSGKQVYEELEPVLAGKYQVQVKLPQDLPMGVYHMVLKQADAVFTQKFVLE